MRAAHPRLDEHPGASALGAAGYIDMLLGAFGFDPPRIFAGGPFSGRAGGDANFEPFLPLSRGEELAWRTRIEGSQGVAEREFNGPVIGWQQQYRDGLAALGTDFSEQDGDEQDRRLDADPAFKHLLYKHAREGCYGALEYGGNRDLRAARSGSRATCSRAATPTTRSAAVPERDADVVVIDRARAAQPPRTCSPTPAGR